MATYNQNNLRLAPYYDDYDPNKRFIQLLALPGRAEQSREFTQLQTLMLDVIKRLSNAILKEGSIVSGMAFSLAGNRLTVQAGQIYLDGIIHQFDEQWVNITKVGTENIGIKLEKSIVTEEEDNTLLDPAQGYANYAQPGAHRIKAEPKLVVNDSSSPTIYTFNDGVLQADHMRPELSVIADVMARRTFDESGNYRVHGMEMWAEAKDANNIWLNIEAGKAYVRGYEVIKPASAKVTVPKAQATRLVQNEPKIYRTGTNLYPLNNKPVKAITKVVAVVEVTENITRGNIAGTMDYLPKYPVVQIVEVKQGATTYVSGTSYQLTTDAVDWSLAGPEPAIGTTYSVKYRYKKTMVITTDFQLTTSGTGDNVVYNLDFSPAGDNPVADTEVTVDYEFYLARKDLVSVNAKGEIIVTQGQPEIQRLISTPNNMDPDVLHLGTLYLYPNSEKTVVNSYSITRMSMEDLQHMMRRIEDMEYNQAMSALDEEAMATEPITELKGIFSDGFNSITKADFSHPDFDISFSLDQGEIVLPTTNITAHLPPVNAGTSQYKSWGRLVTAPMTEVKLVDQPYATTTMLVNPYAVYNRMASISLNPAIDNWVDTEKITIENTDVKTYQITRWWFSGGSPWSDTERYLFNNLQLDSGSSWGGWGNKTGQIVASSSKTLLDESIQYMREREVTVEASNLIPNADNLTATFDGIRVNLTPVTGGLAGTTAGTLKADANGVAKGKFTVPSGIRVGTREVALKNENNTATAPYTANGRKRIVQETILRTRVTVQPYDPLAETFIFDKDQVITAIGLHFSVKDSTKSVNVQIRNTVNGYPGQVILGEKVLLPSQINTSNDSSAETKVVFDDPIYCKANDMYSIVVTTESTTVAMFVAELGKVDLKSGSYVSKQPYVVGTLFSSSNALTWTAHQSMDLKFSIYTARFESAGVLEFTPITGVTADRLVLFSEYLTPDNTGCTWEMKLNDGAYQPVGNYEDKDLSVVANKVQLRATFQSASNISPVLALDGISLITFGTGTSGAYVSRNATISGGYTTVKQVIEASVPSGCAVQPKFSIDGGSTWVTPALQGTEQVDGLFTKYTYTATVASSTNFRAKVEMSAPNSLVRPRARRFMNIMK